MTITGTLIDPTGAPLANLSVQFDALYSLPAPSGANLIVEDTDIEITLDSGGNIPSAFTLLPGNYQVSVDGVSTFKITVPNSGGSANISTLIAA